MSNPKDYMIGWICAVGTEYVAARAYLDEVHAAPSSISEHDRNRYTQGKIGGHRVALAAFPEGEYGKSSAAPVARDMLHTFPNIRVGLLVGIGGGVPTQKHDIRLGDIVVGASPHVDGGLLHYDYEKAITDETFQLTGCLNKPPMALQTAVNALKAKYEIEGHDLKQAVVDALKKVPERTQEKWSRPSKSSDRLYRSQVACPLDIEFNRVEIFSQSPSHFVERHNRAGENESPFIHYGLIAAAENIMKNAMIRDKLVEEKEVLCFEMATADLPDRFPCLVIRGICDYSDSHKTRTWQGYASMAAAAYAKDLLLQVTLSDLDQAKTILELDLYKSPDEQEDVIMGGTWAEGKSVGQQLSQEEKKCHRLFQLAHNSRDTSYEWYKDKTPQGIENTNQWFLKHESFQTWLKEKSGVLLISADPGCGKSVLAKYLIDHGLPQLSTSTVCYFFFDPQGQNKIQQVLCAILHQLFLKKPFLIQHALEKFHDEGKYLINSTSSLWKVFKKATSDHRAGSVIIILDAVDECDNLELGDLLREIRDQSFETEPEASQLKYLLTTRPSQDVVHSFSKFDSPFPYIHIQGEKESDAIYQDVDYFISHRVNQLSERKSLSTETEAYLKERLSANINRTYLWASLLFDYLETEDFENTENGVNFISDPLPMTINQTYEMVFSRSKQPEMLQKALNIVLAVARPMTVSEMNVALNIDYGVKAISDLILESENEFSASLKSLCGPFISISDNKVYLRDQSAREFLIPGEGSSPQIPSEPQCHYSVSLFDANKTMAEICVQYLNLLPFDEGADVFARLSLLEYSAQNWLRHFRGAQIEDEAAIVPLTRRVCDLESDRYLIWARLNEDTPSLGPYGINSDIIAVAYLGLAPVMRLLILEQKFDLEAKDSRYDQTPLLWAIKHKHDDTARILLENGADFEAENNMKETALLLAVRQGQTDIVELLLQKGADFLKKYEEKKTPLLTAALNGHYDIVKKLLERGAEFGTNGTRKSLLRAARSGYTPIIQILLEKGADIETKEDQSNRTLLILAASDGHGKTVRYLLERAADIDVADNGGRTALSWATGNGHMEALKYLLERGAQIDSRDQSGRTPLSWAAENGNSGTMELLLEKDDTMIESVDNDGRNPLLWAARNGQEHIVDYLLGKSASLVESKDNDGRNSLLCAAENGHEPTIQFLLGRSASLIESVDNNGRNALSLAAENGHLDTIKYLVGKNVAMIKSLDHSGRNALLWAAENGEKEVVEYFVDQGVDIESVDHIGRTTLSWTAGSGETDITEYLLGKGAEIKSVDQDGRTALSWAGGNGRTFALSYLASMGLEIESVDKNGRTALSWAAANGYKSTVSYILGRSGKADTVDDSGRTALSWAAGNGHEAVVKYLLSKDVEIDSKDKSGRTVLSWAAGNGHTDVAQTLLTLGANINSVDWQGWTPLWYAVCGSQESSAFLLMANGCDIKWVDQKGRSLLKQALLGRCEGVARGLLEKGASVHSSDQSGRSLLSWASEEGRGDIVRFLLDQGASIELADQSGRTPLSWASGSGYEDVVQLLLDKGASKELADHQGRTPLSWAAWKGHEAVVQLLVDNGIDVHTSDHQGRTALWYAKFLSLGEDGPVAKILQDAGAHD